MFFFKFFKRINVVNFLLGSENEDPQHKSNLGVEQQLLCPNELVFECQRASVCPD